MLNRQSDIERLRSYLFKMDSMDGSKSFLNHITKLKRKWVITMIRRKKNGALRFDENIENSDEQEIYCVCLLYTSDAADDCSIV